MRRGDGGIRARRLIAALLPVAIALAAPVTPAKALTFTVNDKGDGADHTAGNGSCDFDAVAPGDQCTLRAAIGEANAGAGLDDVAFDLPGPGTHTLSPETALPEITAPVTINGYTQRGSRENTLGIRKGDDAKLKVVLSGHDLTETSVHALTIGGGGAGSTIRGLVINRFTGAGILVKGQATIAGNFIGTDKTGSEPRGNEFDGIFGFGGATTTVGGPSPADRNVISDNGDSAITTNAPMTVQGNYIGTARDGKSPLGNHFLFHEHAVGFTFDGTLGGPGDAANVIAFNDGSGVGTLNNGTVPMSRNLIHSNGELAIDLNEDGRTQNDPGDVDVGSNDRQNFPELSKARRKGSKTVVKGELSTTPNDTFTVELFAAPTGSGPAKTFIGKLLVTTDASGNAEVKKSVRPLKPGSRVAATAIAELDGATSEVSRPVKVR